MELKNLINKNVYSIDNAELLGVVTGAYVDIRTNSVKFLSVLGTRSMQIFAYEAMIGCNDYITILNKTSLMDADYSSTNNLVFVSIGYQIIDVRGTNLGKIDDVLIRGKSSLAVTNIVQFALNKVISSRNEVVIANPKNIKYDADSKPILLFNTGERLLAPSLQEVTISQPQIIEELLEVDAPINGEEPIKVEEIYHNIADPIIYTIPTSAKTVSDYSFLFGRMILRDIRDLSNTIILDAGTTVTEQVVTQARIAGKLVDLVRNSR